MSRVDEIQGRREVLAGANWSFQRAPGPDPNDWLFGGSPEIVDALIELPDDVDTLLACVRELEGALKETQDILERFRERGTHATWCERMAHLSVRKWAPAGFCACGAALVDGE